MMIYCRVAFFVLAGMCAVVGNYSFFMESFLAKVSGYERKLMKYPWDLSHVYLQYHQLHSLGKAPSWPTRQATSFATNQQKRKRNYSCRLT